MASKFKPGDVIVIKHKPEIRVLVVAVVDKLYHFRLLFLDQPPEIPPHRMPASIMEEKFRLETSADRVLYGTGVNK